MKFDSMKQPNGYAHQLKLWTGIQLSIQASQSSLTILRAKMKEVGFVYIFLHKIYIWLSSLPFRVQVLRDNAKYAHTSSFPKVR